LPEILKFVLSVLGLSWANIRQKLVTAVGEVAVRAMEVGFDLVVTLVRDGPAAAWAQMQEQLANLKQMAIDGIIDMVVNLVLTRAVPRLIAMFIPGAGFITAIMSIYGTVTTFIAQLSRIAQVITSFLDSMMAIAAGNIEAAANRVESTLAGLLTLAVNFLAGFAGLGRVADQVRNVIARIRAPIDRALDRVIGWIVTMARRLGRFIADSAGNAVSAVRGWLGLRVGFQDAAGASHSIYFAPGGDHELTVASRPRPVLDFLTAVAAANPAQRPQVEVARGHTRTIARLKRDTNLTDATRTAQIRASSNALAGVLRGLSDSTDFFSPIPAQRKLPGGFDVRNDLYINGSGYGSASAALRERAKATISATLIALKATPNSNAAYNALVRDGQIFAAGDGPSRTAAEYRLMSDAAIRALVGRQSYDVDHTQPLAQHWVATGYNSADGARQGHAGGAGNLKIMLSFYNRQAGADGNHYASKFWVGPAFTSNYNMSLRGAKKIKGQDFPP
jgi:hypothetical protein